MSAPTATAGTPVANASRWPLERALFLMAGTLTIVSVLLAVAVSQWFLLLTAFVGLNQWLFVAVGACPASMVIGRVLVLEPPCDRSGR